MTLASDSSYVARAVRFQPHGSDVSYDAVIIEHDKSRDGVRHLFKIHIVDAAAYDKYPPRVMASESELTDREATAG